MIRAENGPFLALIAKRAKNGPDQGSEQGQKWPSQSGPKIEEKVTKISSKHCFDIFLGSGHLKLKEM